MYDPLKATIRPLKTDVLVSDMDLGEMKTTSGLIIRSDDGKAHGVKPRWAKIYKIGEDVKLDLKEGQWVLIEHGRWTRKVKIDDGKEIKEIQKIDLDAILLISDNRPNDVYLGQEFTHGSSADINALT